MVGVPGPFGLGGRPTVRFVFDFVDFFMGYRYHNLLGDGK